MQTSLTAPLAGPVTSRQCPSCGHHELGVTATDGTFQPLRPGMWIQVVEPPGPSSCSPEPPMHSPAAPASPRLWIPDPAKGQRHLRLKFAVWVPQGSCHSMNGEVYQRAYLEKLQGLIAEEAPAITAVLLDRFFSAPHLASGNPEEIASALWTELKEIRRPVYDVCSWLGEGREGHLAEVPQGEWEKSPDPMEPNEAIWKTELQALTLEDFLGLL